MPQSEGWPFQRLLVDHMFHGTTRVWWSMDPSFNDPQPQQFQLQAGYTGNGNALDWVDIGEPATNAYYLDDDSGRELSGKRLLTHYRVVVTTGRGRYVSNPQGLWGTLNTKDWNTAKEIVRKERLRLQLVSKEGYLIRKMRYGVRSTANTDTLTGEIIDSSYPGSWGTAFKVGYHPPVNIMADFEEQDVTERRGGDNIAEYSTRPAEFTVRILGFPDVAKEDVWVDATNDQRWLIGDIRVTASLRGVPLIYSVRMSLIPYDNVIYKIPVNSLSYDLTDTNHFQPTVGDGCVRVDHDYGGESNYVYQTGDCCGIAGATILAFKKSDWDLGLRVPSAAVATSQTTTNGTWAWAMMLNPGDYMLVFEKLGEYGPDAVLLTVQPPDPGPPPSLSSLSSSVSIADSFGGF